MKGVKVKNFFNVLVVYFANDRVPNVDDGLGQPIALAPKPNGGAAETCRCVVVRVDMVDG